MKQTLLILFLAILLATPLVIGVGQTLDDVVYLKNGSIIRGIITEQIPNKTLKIQTKDGNVFVYKIDEVEKISKEPPPGTRPDAPRAARPKGYKNPAVSFVLSWLVPGVGQMYNGQTGKGILQLCATAVGYTLFIIERPRTEEVWVYDYGNYYYGYWEMQDKGNGAIAWPAFILGFGVHVWSMIDAPVTASRMNREGGLSFNEVKLNKNLKLAFSPIDFQRGTVGPNIKMQLNF